jgi:NitT/TauT family transport system substrate-binding protein
MDRPLLDEIWDSFNFRVTLEQALLVSLENQAAWAAKRKITDARDVPNFLDFIYIDGLSAVKPSAITIIR